MAGGAGPPTVYSFRGSLFGPERAFKLTPDGLVVADVRLDYRDVNRVRLYQVCAQDGDMIKRCKIHGGGRAVRLQSAHIAGWGRVQDRSMHFEPFVHEFLLRVAHANPAVLVSSGMPRATRVGWLLVLLMVGGLALGGLAQLATGEWDGLWLIGVALTTVPLAVTMISKKPSRLVRIEDVAAASGRSDRFG